MDLLPVILAIAQAEGPSSVLGQIITAILANEHVHVADHHKHRARRQYTRMMEVAHATNLAKLTPQELELWDSQNRVNSFLVSVVTSHEKRLRRIEQVLHDDGKL